MEVVTQTMLRKYYALPAEHGAWIWMLGPFVLGTAAGGDISPRLLWLLGAGLAAFLARQPATILAKVQSGRRPRRQFKPALAWLLIYGSMALLLLMPLLRVGLWQLPLLAIPGVPVFAWHLWLVRQRAERERPGVEIVAAGVLALMAPAAYWTAGGQDQLLAVLSWLIGWLQSAASIVHIHLRLEQRGWPSIPSGLRRRLRPGWRSIAYHSFNLVAASGLAYFASLPIHLPIAFAIVWLDAVHGILVPAVGYSPRRIGFRQLFFSTLFFFVSGWGFWLMASG